MGIILFDGICNLCSGIVFFIIKRDKRRVFRLAALQSAAGEGFCRHYSLSREQYDTVYYVRDHVCYEKSTAILHILRDLGGGWQMLYFLIWIPACIRDIPYGWIARYRYKLFGKKVSCLLPSPDIQDRFME